MTTRLIKIAVVYMMIGMTLGIVMGITNHHEYRSVHAHINLLGWATLALAALVFHVFPHLATTRLAAAWFWIYNISVPIALASLALMFAGYDWAKPGVEIGHTVVWAAGVMFGVNVLWNLKPVHATRTMGAPARVGA